MLFFALVIGIPCAAHYFILEFWAASFLSAFLTAALTGLLIFVPDGSLSKYGAFVLGGSLLMLVPAFLIGMLFQNSPRHRAHIAKVAASREGVRRGIIVGAGAVAIGLSIGAAILFRHSPGAVFPGKAFAGAVVFLLLGAWQLWVGLRVLAAHKRPAD